MKKMIGLAFCTAFLVAGCNETPKQETATVEKKAPAAVAAVAPATPAQSVEAAPAAEAPKATITDIDWNKALEMSKAGAVLIDVRTPAEVAEGMAPAKAEGALSAVTFAIPEGGTLHLSAKGDLPIAPMSAIMNVAITLLCAYPLAQKTFSGRKFVSKMLTITMIFGGGMIPNYLLVKQLKMLNTIWAVLIPSLMSATNVIIVRNYIETNLSGELEEAARVDGCSPIKYFSHFVLPLSKSIIAVVTMYYAVSHWNSYFSAFLYLNDRELFPLQLFLRDILVNSQFDNSIVDDPEMAQVVQNAADALKYSIIVISTAPLMLAYPLVQKYFVKGIMVGSVKG